MRKRLCYRGVFGGVFAAVVALAAAAAAGGCARDGQECAIPCQDHEECIDGRCVWVESCSPVPLHDPEWVDILFVIDNSRTMEAAQRALIRSLPSLFDVLRYPGFNNKLPRLHLGVVSTDLGARGHRVPGCAGPGDDGQLLASPRVPGCVAPIKPYIEYIDGVTNVNNPAVTDPVKKVEQALQCIAGIGTGGCGFGSPLEAARRALDPKLARNPGFIRKSASLALVFITDEDDCSVARPDFFAPGRAASDPLTSFRCFERGVRCDCPQGACEPATPGPRKSCRPAYDWLHEIDDYVEWFTGLKDPDRLLVFAIGGPTGRVEVGLEGRRPTLLPACRGPGRAVKGRPAVRLEALIDGVNKRGAAGYFNEGIDARLGHRLPVEICSPDLRPAMRLLGTAIVESLLRQAAKRDSKTLPIGCGG